MNLVQGGCLLGLWLILFLIIHCLFIGWVYFSEAIGIPHPQVSRTITISAIIDVIVSIVEVCSEGLILGVFPKGEPTPRVWHLACITRSQHNWILNRIFFFRITVPTNICVKQSDFHEADLWEWGQILKCWKWTLWCYHRHCWLECEAEQS